MFGKVGATRVDGTVERHLPIDRTAARLNEHSDPLQRRESRRTVEEMGVDTVTTTAADFSPEVAGCTASTVAEPRGRPDSVAWAPEVTFSASTRVLCSENVSAR